MAYAMAVDHRLAFSERSLDPTSFLKKNNNFVQLLKHAPPLDYKSLGYVILLNRPRPSNILKTSAGQTEKIERPFYASLPFSFKMLSIHSLFSCQLHFLG